MSLLYSNANIVPLKTTCGDEFFHNQEVLRDRFNCIMEPHDTLDVIHLSLSSHQLGLILRFTDLLIFPSDRYDIIPLLEAAEYLRLNEMYTNLLRLYINIFFINQRIPPLRAEATTSEYITKLRQIPGMVRGPPGDVGVSPGTSCPKGH